MTDSSTRPLHVFLCHSSGDKPIVRELYQKLNGEDWIDVWLDEEKLYPGQDWNYEIEQALDNSDAVIVTLSTDSISKEGYVQKELRFVLDIAQEKPEGTIFILPVRLEDCERPRRLQSIHGIDYFPPEHREQAYTRLRRSLELRARKLKLLTDEPKDSLAPPLLSPVIATPPVLEPHKTDQSVSLQPTPPATPLGAVPKMKPVFQFGRMLVLLLPIAGVFGLSPVLRDIFDSFSPMTGIMQEIFFGFWSFLAFPILLLLLLPYMPPYFSHFYNMAANLERLVAVTASGYLAVMFFRTTVYDIFPLHWGFLLMIMAFFIAPTNILLEWISSKEKAQNWQEWPIWVWFLLVSIILPWIGLFYYLFLRMA